MKATFMRCLESYISENDFICDSYWLWIPDHKLSKTEDEKIAKWSKNKTIKTIKKLKLGGKCYDLGMTKKGKYISNCSKYS